MNFSFKVYKKISNLFEQIEVLGVTEISNKLGISRVIVHKVLKQLLVENKVKKVGKASHTRYKSLIFDGEKKIKEVSNTEIIDFKTKKFFDENFYKFDSDGKVLKGFSGFEYWVKDRNFDLNKSIVKFRSIFNYIEGLEDKYGLLDSTEIFNNKFEKNYMNKVFYAGEYSFMEFGRSKLAEITFYAKQSQDKKLINESIDEIFYKLECIIKTQNIDCIAITPWSIDRKNQLLGVLKNRLSIFNLDFLNIIKYYPDNIPIPQKSIKSKSGRIKNAKNTIFVHDENTKNYSNILLIDDFVGSGATLNITAQKIKQAGGKNIIGFSFVGSMDLSYEVINEI
ncbi:hypothetical protein CSA08_02135 [Candidatus Gracilibacteria bacterium]|nr:MAG: hypothetical protein CSA08_02135 [Candidatus Gracilibacteria bacterium]